MTDELGPTLLEKAARFDPDFYLRICPAARRALARGEARDAEEHYWSVGISVGVDPNAFFSESFYSALNEDVAAAIDQGDLRSGFDHYQGLGRAEGRKPTGLWTVDEAWYLGKYPEAAREIEEEGLANVFEHYLDRSLRQGHCPHPAFDEGYYLERYPDAESEVASGLFLNGYHHFLSMGLAKGLKPHPAYIQDHYLLWNEDLDRRHRNGNLPSAYLHLISTGLAEARKWVLDAGDRGTKEVATEIAMVKLEELLGSHSRLRFDRDPEPEVSILLVLFNRAELTLSCLRSLQLLEEVSTEIIIVDNDSTDRTSDLLDRIEGATICRNKRNEGFTRAANQAAAMARGRHLLFLNNDTELLPASLRSAVARLDGDDTIGVVGGRIIGLDGKLQEAGSIVWKDATTEGYGRRDDPSSGAYLFPRDVDYCSGVFLLTPRALFEELGGLDLAFSPAYYEEADYCFRLRERGKRVVYDPGSVVIHFETASLQHDSELHSLLGGNRPVFLARHRQALRDAWPPLVKNFFPSSNRRDYRARILVLDDLVPLEKYGGGSPRMLEIIRLLMELDLFVTFFAANPIPIERQEIARELPESTHLEIIRHLGRHRFLDFWKGRSDHYDILLVSRPHNLLELRKLGFDPRKEKARVIYDAEAVFSKRRALQLEVLGDEAPQEAAMDLELELELARSADEIWAVTESEGRFLVDEGQRLSIIGLVAEGQAGERSFDERQGLLFIGRLDERWNPNVDALIWYLEEIHPRVTEILGAPLPLTVIGEPEESWLPRAEGLRVEGRVENLESFYDSSRVFLAPSRFAAGIPQKITGAAAHGLPVVATSLLVEQLGWLAGSEIADGGNNDPDRFAAAVADVHSQRNLWSTLRTQALDRVGRDQSREAVRTALREALALENRPKTRVE